MIPDLKSFVRVFVSLGLDYDYEVSVQQDRTGFMRIKLIKGRKKCARAVPLTEILQAKSPTWLAQANFRSMHKSLGGKVLEEEIMKELMEEMNAKRQ